jgi:hypothetical protein
MLSPALTLDALRAAVVGSARAARALAVAPETVFAEISARVGAILAARPPARRAELLARVRWWTIHGYYGGE